MLLTLLILLTALNLVTLPKASMLMDIGLKNAAEKQLMYLWYISLFVSIIALGFLIHSLMGGTVS